MRVQVKIIVKDEIPERLAYARDFYLPDDAVVGDALFGTVDALDKSIFFARLRPAAEQSLN